MITALTALRWIVSTSGIELRLRLAAIAFLYSGWDADDVVAGVKHLMAMGMVECNRVRTQQIKP